MTDPKLLDMSLSALHEDRKLLHQVLQSASIETGISYADCYARIVDNERNGLGPHTVRNALSWLGADAGGVESTVKLLDQCDAAVTKDLSRKTALKRDSFGRVTLDQNYKGRPQLFDAHGRVTNPAEAGDRLRRAQRIWPNVYDGPDGIQKFELEDSQHLSAGIDFLKTAELDRDAAQAQARVGQTARELDRAVVADSERRRNVRQLDEQIDELSEKRLKLDGAPQSAVESTVKLLDLPVFAGWSDGQKKALRRAQKRLRRLDMPTSVKNLQWALDQGIAGEPMPKKPKVERAAATPAPPGVDPRSHAMHERVVARLREVNAPESEYPKVLEQILNEGA